MLYKNRKLIFIPYCLEGGCLCKAAAALPQQGAAVVFAETQVLVLLTSLKYSQFLELFTLGK